MGSARLDGRAGRTGEFRRRRGGQYRHPKTPEADCALLHRQRKGRADQGIVQRPARHIRDFR